VSAARSGGARSVIRTPDQRLRVFVSSTLKELGAERAVVRGAIERLAAAPVMFELGARPHPPRSLYRAYLEQSDIFVGLYWERYGWVAPGEEVSGLEDEYNLVPDDMPRLVYIKETSGTREPRLTALLDRIRSDDRASFKYFSDPAELGDLLVSDLAVLLAERFEESRPTAAPIAPPDEGDGAGVPAPLPAPLTQLLGREQEVEHVVDLVRADAVRLVTLTGPGGIGKSRLAIEVARRMAPEYPDGVTFIPLAPVDAAALVPSAVAQALGVRDTGDLPLEQKLVIALRDRRSLLVLDNFEQVLAAVPLVIALLEGAPRLTLLVTSRTLLRIAGERSVEVLPLALPDPRSAPWLPGSRPSPAVALFVERARSVKPDFELTSANVAAVEGISLRLEGVPLAIELAAARVRLLTPATLLDRLDRQLTVLIGGQRNLPPRQQAVRSTIDWSTRLLDEPERDLLWRLGMFSGRFSLDAVEAIAGGFPGDVLMILEALVDSSLVRQQDRNGRTYFAMLATVREYALEKLEGAGLLDEVRDRHTRYFVELARQASRDLAGPRQAECVAELADERDNLRATARHLLDSRDWEAAADFAWCLYTYWWLGGLLGEVRGWMDDLLATEAPLTDRSRAIALYFTCAIGFWQQPAPQIVPGLTESAELFRRVGSPAEEALTLISLALAHLSGATPDVPTASAVLDRSLRLFREAGDLWGEGMALVSRGRLSLLTQDSDAALADFTAAAALAEARQDGLGISIALHHLGWAHLLRGAVPEAAAALERALRLSLDVGHDDGVAYGLEGCIGVAALQGDVERAGRLLGAAQSLRERVGLFNPAAFTFHSQLVAHIRAGQGAELFEQGYQAGRRMSADEAVEEALALTRDPPVALAAEGRA
jgi:predicted ATPase